MSHNSQTCPLQNTLKILGGKWKLVIIHNLDSKPHRFNDLKRTIGAISTKVLSDQLKDLEKDKFITRTTLPTNPPQVEYALTVKGKSLLPIIKKLHEWGKKH